jgi:hypothetical protein
MCDQFELNHHSASLDRTNKEFSTKLPEATAAFKDNVY